MVKDQYLFLIFYNALIGCCYHSLDHGLKLGTSSLHEAKHQGVSKLVNTNIRVIYITCMFSPFFFFYIQMFEYFLRVSSVAKLQFSC